MKTLNNMLKKINLLAIMGIIVAMGAVAFTAPEKDSALTAYQYNSDSDDIEVIKNPNNWSPVSTGSEPSCNNEEILPCIITLDGDLDQFLGDLTDLAELLSSTNLTSTKSKSSSN